MILKRRHIRAKKQAPEEEQEDEQEEEDPSHFQEIPFEYSLIHKYLYHPSVFRK